MGRDKDKNRETLSESLTREKALVNMEGLIKAFRVSTWSWNKSVFSSGISALPVGLVNMSGCQTLMTLSAPKMVINKKKMNAICKIQF